MTAHFEAKKHAYRQTQDGVVISFVVHPNDISPEIAAAPLGSHYMVALVVIGEDGQPVSVPTKKDLTPKPPAEHKDRKPFHTLPLSQQAALRCNDAKFWDFLSWLYNRTILSEEAAAKTVRIACAVASRGEFNQDHTAAARWKDLDRQFSEWMTDQRYADSMR